MLFHVFSVKVARAGRTPRGGPSYEAAWYAVDMLWFLIGCVVVVVFAVLVIAIALENRD